MTDEESIDTTLAQAVERCLAKEPDDRFQTAADLGAALVERRELHVPLRVFVKRLCLSLYSGTALSLVGVLASLQLASALVLGHWVTAAAAGEACGYRRQAVARRCNA